MEPRILIVDDEPDLEMLVSQKFRRQIRQGKIGFLFAHDGEEALSLLNEQTAVDLVLSDINMPRMDGLTLLSKIQELDRLIYTVVVSAYGDMKNIRTAMNRGAFDFITKPIEFEDFEATIVRAVEELTKVRELHGLHEAAEQTKVTLSRYFSPNVAQQLAENPAFLELGGERRDLTFVFTDLTDFTSLVEELEPSIIVQLLNEYLDQMTQIVFRHGGTLDKIVGDAVHAFFGAPAAQSDHAARAIACAMEFDAFAEAFRNQKTSEGIPLGVTRIGVHSGQAIVGNFGGELFYDYTAHGDAINTAARLESVNKFLGTRVCVSASVVEQVVGFAGRPVGTLILKGKNEGVEVYEPLTSETANCPATEAYKAAFQMLKAKDPGASQAFAAVVGQFGEDSLATFHLRRLLAGESGAEISMSEK